MHSRVVTAQVQPSRLDEAIDIYRDSIVPATRQQKGLKSISLVVDRKTGKAMSITLWETEADMTAANANLQQHLAKLAPVFAAPPVSEHFEVIVQE